MSSREAKLLDGVLKLVIVGWIGWVSNTLVQLKSAVASISPQKCVAAAPVKPDLKEQPRERSPRLASPIWPLPEISGSFRKENSDEKK